MDQRALVRVQDGITNLRHQLQPLPHVEPVGVAVVEQRLPVHEFHGEVRLAPERGLGRARFVDLGDAGVLQPPQRLRLVLEAANHVALAYPARMTFRATVRCGNACSAS